MNNIILIGMPGVGKSTVGVVLAKTLGYAFLDSDLLIQEREGLLLHEIIEKYGLERFNQIESEVNASIEAEDTVIATGGSVVYGTEAMMHLKALGTVVYLKLSYEELTNVLVISINVAFPSVPERLWKPCTKNVFLFMSAMQM